MICVEYGMFKKSKKHYVPFELFLKILAFSSLFYCLLSDWISPCCLFPQTIMISLTAHISRMAFYPISTPSPTAAGCAWWRNTSSCTDLTSPPSTRGMSSLHRASTSNPSFWTMPSLDFHFCATSTWWTPVLKIVIFLIIWWELRLETSSNKQEYHDLDLSRSLHETDTNRD